MTSRNSTTAVASQLEAGVGVIETYTGRMVDLANMRPEDVCAEDIAHSLGNLCRFNGHTKQFYSVAQHCVVMSVLILRDLPAGMLYSKRIRHQRLALLHDAHEAYVGDVTKPLKPLLGPEYKRLVGVIDAAIYAAFEIEPPTEEEKRVIKHADLRMLATEKKQLLGDGQWATELPEPYDVEIFNGLDAEKAGKDYHLHLKYLFAGQGVAQ